MACDLEPMRGWVESSGRDHLHHVGLALLPLLPDLPENGLCEACESHVPFLTTVAKADEGFIPVPRALPGPVADYTKSLAAEGVPLSTLLRAFELGQTDLWRRFASWLREEDLALTDGQRASALELGGVRIFSYFGTITNEVIVTYSREQSRREVRANTRRAEVVNSVLTGTVEERAASDALGYQLSAEHVAFVAWVADPSDGDRLDALATELGKNLGSWQSIWVPDGLVSIHGWLSADEDVWRREARTLELPDRIGLAFGSPHQKMAGFRASHNESLEARRIAEATSARNPVLYEDVAIAALASHNQELAVSFVEGLLGQLISSDAGSEKLMQTLKTYLDESASPTRTAHRLGVHTNTVIKRVKRLEELLGMPLDSNTAALRLAVELAPLVPSNN